MNTTFVPAVPPPTPVNTVLIALTETEVARLMALLYYMELGSVLYRQLDEGGIRRDPITLERLRQDRPIGGYSAIYLDDSDSP